jgi:flagellar protein FlgJ
VNTINGNIDNAIMSKVSGTEAKLKNISSGSKFEERLAEARGLTNEISPAVKNINFKSPAEKKLWDTCVEVESLFVAKMFKEMRNSVDKTEWINGGFAEEIFEDMLYDEYALQLSKNSSIGMAKMIYEEMSRNI